jgi:hypothetical protein
MDSIPGSNCAEVLLSIHLPLREVVRALMQELDLTVDEANAAAAAAEQHYANPRGDRDHARR